MEVLRKYISASQLVDKEYHNTPLKAEGEVPKALFGTLFRNGNGRFVHQGVTYQHLFDGDGMVTAFRFNGDGQVYYSNRYVRTREFVEEETAGRMLYRSFGTNLPGGFLRNFMKMRFKNAANTSVIYHGGKLLALWEGGLPHEINPRTLETVGRYDFEGVLQNRFSFLDAKINPELPFSAHPKIHPQTGVLHNFGTLAGAKQRLLLYQVAPSGSAQISKVVELPGLIFTHDFILTETGKQIFFLTPVSFDLWKTFSGWQSPVDSIRVDKRQKTQILIVDGDRVQSHFIDFCFIFHFSNGWETPDGQIVIDALTMTEFPEARMTPDALGQEENNIPNAQLYRFTIHPTEEKVHQELLSPYPSELPFLHPDRTGRPYRYFWGLGGPGENTYQLLQGMQVVDLDEGSAHFKDLRPHLPGEPVFVPKPNARHEADGWLLYLLFDTKIEETRLVIADPLTLEVIARLPLPHNIPLGFHGQWVPEVFD